LIGVPAIRSAAAVTPLLPTRPAAHWTVTRDSPAREYRYQLKVGRHAGPPRVARRARLASHVSARRGVEREPPRFRAMRGGRRVGPEARRDLKAGPIMRAVEFVATRS